MFSYLADHLRMSGSNVWKYLVCIAEVEVELTTLRASLRTVCHGVVNRLTPDDMTRVRGDDASS